MSETEDVQAVIRKDDGQEKSSESVPRSTNEVNVVEEHLDEQKPPRKEPEQESRQRPEEAERKPERESGKEETPKPATPSASEEEKPVDSRRDSGNAVAEWNSLTVLVERLRAALEVPRAREEEHATVPRDPGDSREERRESMEAQNAGYPELKKDLAFLGDLLLSDIQTALSRLRETLERIDVEALARYGAASDPSGKLHLLKLVSSLLSRLQVPEKVVRSEVKAPTTGRKRRGSERHTIGVSAEELAHARKWLEKENGVTDLIRPRREESTAAEEIHDKCIKEAFNQRQSLRDRNKDLETCAYCPKLEPGKTEQSMNHRPVDSCQNEQEEKNDSEEKNRVGKIVAALRQRAELQQTASKCGNKFATKKSKIKRANTIDIPSYLKLQAESLGKDGAGCVSLRRPINVGDKTIPNASNLAVPSFQPKTENDRKFLALISKNNNESPPAHAPPGFKTFGYTKATDLSSMTNENWNSRFSNIKTTFDKPNDERTNRISNSRMEKRVPGVSHATQRFAFMTKDRNENAVSYVNSPGAGFQHAASSPFRRIEKPTVPPKATSTSPKAAPTYPWIKDTAPHPGGSLREKAKMMFDRENAQSQPFKVKSGETYEKHAMPRPPWIEHGKKESKSNNTVTENGRLDYRSFFKQFAPLNTRNPPLNSKVFEEARRHEYLEAAQYEKNPNVVDGKISFKMIPEKSNYRAVNARNAVETVPNRSETGVKAFPDATLRGSSSVAVQTGIDDDHPEEVRSFRVAPKVVKGSSVCNNASVQTCNELRQTAPVSNMGSEQWKMCYDSNRVLDLNYHEADDRVTFDHNQNYHAIPNDSQPRNYSYPVQDVHGKEEYPVSDRFVPPSNETIAYPVITNYYQQGNERFPKDQVYPLQYPVANQEFQVNNREYPLDNQIPSYQHTPSSQTRPEETIYEQKESPWCVENTGFLDDENIQNQDISLETGVITRYACAIATVATNANSPETKSEDGLNSQTSSSPSPSQPWPYPRPKTAADETSEDEIRRHNMLQQSLVRRLQNEHVSLNEPYKSGQPLNPIQPNYFNQRPNYSQPVTVSPGKFLSPEVPKRTVPTINELKRLDPLPKAAPSSNPANRVTALKEAYEQPAAPKPIKKERSPIPNPVDSSDEYLVSCANKPSRSIVLSKSESWHQLAISTNYPRSSQTANKTSSNWTAKAGYLPKPPKPKSPSKSKSKQYEASSDSVRKMEDKIRRYFDQPNESVAAEAKDSRNRRLSPRGPSEKGMVGLSRSRTMPGICDEKLRLVLPPPQAPLLNVNTADVDKVFDDLFEEATRSDSYHH